MAKKVTALIKLQVPAGKATPSAADRPGARPARREHPRLLQGFQRPYRQAGRPDHPVVITVYQDRSFTFITKTPPAAVLIKKACGLEHASGRPNRDKVANITKAQVREIAELKMPDLNAASIEAAMSMVGRHRPLHGRRGGRLNAARATRTWEGYWPA